MTVDDIITLPFTKAILDKTAANTIRKYSHTHKSLMYKRTPVELLDNIFMGDLAKNALLEYLRQHCTAPILDYDEIRTDNFTEPDPGWDLLIGKKQIKLEVKSSIPFKAESRQSIINKRDIKITASHDKGNKWILPETFESHIYVQIYFYSNTYKKGYQNFESLQEILVTDPESIHNIIKTAKYSQPLFFGWNSKENIIDQIAELSNKTWTFASTTRIYWRCPINRALTLKELTEIINGDQGLQ